MNHQDADMGNAGDDLLIARYDDDRFLRKFLAGGTRGVSLLRARIALINTSKNAELIRNVLILGESGVGKNYVAQVIAGHRQWLVARNSDELDDKLQKRLETYTDQLAEVSLPGLTDTLVESELFGHKKGAFTGADADHTGYLGEDYTDILDEFGDATLPLQAKLLRVLNSGQYRPVGGNRGSETTVSARLLLATNRDLAAMVHGGHFRHDLLWRITQVVTVVPPLREQRDGIPMIITNVLEAASVEREGGFSPMPRLSREDIQYASAYPWPGNARQLRHALARWLLHDGQVRLPDVVEEIERETRKLWQVAGPDGDIETAVTRRLREARLSKTLLILSSL